MKKSRVPALRKRFNEIDAAILQLLHARAGLSHEMARLKKDMKMSALQKDVWEKHLQKRLQENKKLDNSPAFVEKLFTVIHKESLRIQKQAMKSKK
jgi:chorismate mutase